MPSVRADTIDRLRLAVSSAAVAVALVCVAPAVPAAQDAQTPVFRAGVDSVSVDVIVTDKQGQPVTDLTAADFEIRESGRPQTVETFRLVQLDDGIDDPAAAREILSLDEQERETARLENRIFVIFFDDYHVRRGNALTLRSALASFVSGLSAHDLVAVVLPLSPMNALTFSRSHDASANEISHLEGRKYDYTPKNALEAQYQNRTPAEQEQYRNDLTIGGLRQLCEALGKLRDGKKTVLFVSEGLSGSFPVGVRTTGGTGAPPTVGTPRDPTPIEQSQTFLNAAGLTNLFQRVYSEAARSNTSIYTLDPRGLATTEFDLGDNVSSVSNRQYLAEATDSLRVLADQTEGRAILDRNDPGAALQQMVRDNTTYYLLSYTSTLAPRDGKFHEIQVRVKRKDVEVRARRGYWALSPDEVTKAIAPKITKPTDVLLALDALSAATETARTRPVNVWMGAARGPADKAVVTLVWDAGPSGEAGSDASRSTSAMDIIDHVSISATSIYGDLLYSGPVPRDETASGRTAGHVTFGAPPGAVKVSVTIQNAKGMRLDSSETAIDVPDFTKTGPQIGTPFVYRGRTARDLQQVRTSPFALPTISRSFSRTERMLVRVNVYGPGGTAPAVTMRLLNQNGALVTALPAPVSVNDTLVESELGLGGFPPGDYLIEITADAAGATTRQLLAFHVTG